MNLRNGVIHSVFRFLVLAMVFTFALTGVYAEKGGKGKPGGGGGGGSQPPYDPAIAYSSNLYCGRGDLYAMNEDGSNKTLLLQGGDNPAWLPGGWLLFNHSGTTLDGEGIYVVDAVDPQDPLARILESGGCSDVVVNPADPDMIAWADGENEVTFGVQDPFGWDTVVIDTDPYYVFPSSWSHDGTRITAWVFDTASNSFEDDWIYTVVYDDNGLPTGLTTLRNVTEGMAAQGWDMGITDWSNQTDRWLLAPGTQGSQWPVTNALFLVDLSYELPVFHTIAENPKVSFGSARWSPCDDRVLVEQTSNPQSIGGGSHKLTIYDLAFDELSGDFLGVTGSNELPSSKKEQFFHPDWRPARVGECSGP